MAHARILTAARTRLEPLFYQAAVYFTLSILDDPI